MALTQLGVVSVEKLRRNRRYAVVAIALIAALPTLDPITLMLEMVPLLMLYELSIQVARLVAPRGQGDSIATPG